MDLGGRVQFVRGDQSSPDDLAKAIPALGGEPNIVIDDGSHIAEHGRISFDFLFPRMPPGGLYVIEDLHTSYWESYGGAPNAPLSTAIGLAKDLVDAVQAQDLTYLRYQAQAAPLVMDGVAAIHVYPGIVFVVKSS